MKPIFNNPLQFSLSGGIAAAIWMANFCGVHGAFIIETASTPTILHPELAGQNIDLFINNTGSATPVGGFDLTVLINGGSGPAPQVTISGPGSVNLRAGPVFTTSNSLQAGQAASTAYSLSFSVFVTDPINNAPSLPSGRTLLGQLMVSTVGASPGPWPMLFNGSELNNPAGDSLGLQHSPTSLELAAVPEPAETVVVTALVLGGLGLVRRLVRTRRSAVVV